MTPTQASSHSAGAIGPSVPAMKRCEWSDLLVENCGHCRGTLHSLDGLKPEADRPEEIDGTWTIANFDSECGCGCNLRIGQGDEIALARVGDVEEWVLLEHARKPWVQP